MIIITSKKTGLSSQAARRARKEAGKEAEDKATAERNAKAQVGSFHVSVVTIHSTGSLLEGGVR